MFTQLQHGMKDGHYHVYSKEELLPEWRYVRAPGLGQALVVADLGYVFDDDFVPFVKEVGREFNRSTNDLSSVFGWNGYDSKSAKMRVPLVVKGPAFKVIYLTCAHTLKMHFNATTWRQ